MLASVENPWVDVPGPPHVLAEDVPILRRRRGTWDDLHHHNLPIPFMGPQDAPVVLLSLNPSARTDEAALGPAFEEERRRALRFLQDDSPMWWLSRKWARSRTDGHDYWARRFADLRRRVYPRLDEPSGLEALARQLLLVELFPYPTDNLKRVRGIHSLPSQRFGFQLVRRAIAEKRLIVALRSLSDWMEVVRELREAPFVPPPGHMPAHR